MSDHDETVCDQVNGMMSDLLHRTANALKGDPGPHTLHSWHDLPEVAADLRAAALALPEQDGARQVTDAMVEAMTEARVRRMLPHTLLDGLRRDYPGVWAIWRTESREDLTAALGARPEQREALDEEVVDRAAEALWREHGEQRVNQQSARSMVLTMLGETHPFTPIAAPAAVPVPVVTEPARPGRWWRLVADDGRVLAESSDEEEIRGFASPGDRVERLFEYEPPEPEWRPAAALSSSAPAATEDKKR